MNKLIFITTLLSGLSLFAGNVGGGAPFKIEDSDNLVINGTIFQLGAGNVGGGYKPVFEGSVGGGYKLNLEALEGNSGGGLTPAF